ncbi:MAG: flagellin [Pseudomonadota bacterium]
MNEVATVGDLARTLIFRRRNADVRSEIDRLTKEISTGRKADLPAALSGDFTVLASVERDIRSLAAYGTATTELTARASAMQTMLGTIQDQTDKFIPQLLAARGTNQQSYTENLAEEARVKMDSAVSALNTNFGGRTLFAGAAVDGPALADADVILAAVEAAVAGVAADAATVEAEVAAWFAPGGGFDTVGYIGSANPVGAQPVSSTQSLSINITAEDTRLREILSGIALAAMADRPPLAGTLSEQTELAEMAGTALLRSQTGLSTLRGEVGAVEAELDSVVTRNGAEETALRITRGELADADIYDSSTQLEAVQTQLELLYAITVRSSELTLTRFL